MRAGFAIFIPAKQWRFWDQPEDEIISGHLYRGGVCSLSHTQDGLTIRIAHPSISRKDVAGIKGKRVAIAGKRERDGRWVGINRSNFIGRITVVTHTQTEILLQVENDYGLTNPDPEYWSHTNHLRLNPGELGLQYASKYGERRHAKPPWPKVWRLIGGTHYPIDPNTPNRVESLQPPRYLTVGAAAVSLTRPRWGFDPTTLPEEFTRQIEDNKVIAQFGGGPDNSYVQGLVAGRTNVRYRYKQPNVVTDYTYPLIVVSEGLAFTDAEVGVPVDVSFTTSAGADEAEDQARAGEDGFTFDSRNANVVTVIPQRIGEFQVGPAESGTINVIVVYPITEANRGPDVSTIPVQVVRAVLILDIGDYLNPDQSVVTEIRNLMPANIVRIDTLTNNRYRIVPLDDGRADGTLRAVFAMGVRTPTERPVGFRVPLGFTPFRITLPRKVLFSNFQGISVDSFTQGSLRITGLGDEDRPVGALAPDSSVIVDGSSVTVTPSVRHDPTSLTDFNTYSDGLRRMFIALADPLVAGVTTVQFQDRNLLNFNLRLRVVGYGPQPPRRQRTIAMGQTATIPAVAGSVMTALDTDTARVGSATMNGGQYSATVTAVAPGETMVERRDPNGISLNYHIMVTR